jgi:uncharacterized protein (TIGR03437 family)
VSNLRAAPLTAVNTPVTVLLITNSNATLVIRNNPVTVGLTRPGLLANASSTQIVCTGSKLPDDLTFSNFVKRGTQFLTLRVTEGSAGAFLAREAGASNGVRIMVRYSGFPADARLYVPDVIAGSSSSEPTSAGDLGLASSGGESVFPEAGLVLSRVRFTDSSGAGGTLAFVPPAAAGGLAFNDVSEVGLVNGSGVAVYEVVASNSNIFESAHLPTFVGLDAQSSGRNTIAHARVSLAPLSNVREASTNAPIPRFADVPPGLDCDILRDCTAKYFPQLFVDPQPLQFRLPARSTGYWSKYVRVLNRGGGVLNWGTRIEYLRGQGWLRANPDSGIGTASLNLYANPENLDPGLYEADFTVDAGPLAGSRTFRVTLDVFALPPPAPTPPVVRESGNAANLRVGQLVPGSLATLKGERLGGQDVRVTFDGISARILFASDTQINLLVPAELAGRPVAQMQVTANNIASAGQTVQLAATAPAIFAGGVLNQDGFPNSPTNPEFVGRVFQVFATGLPLPGQGRITAKVHDREIDAPIFAGPAPNLTGVQQVNFPVPDDLPAMTSEVLVCGVPNNDPARKFCSPPYEVVLRRPD